MKIKAKPLVWQEEYDYPAVSETPIGRYEIGACDVYRGKFYLTWPRMCESEPGLEFGIASIDEARKLAEAQHQKTCQGLDQMFEVEP